MFNHLKKLISYFHGTNTPSSRYHQEWSRAIQRSKQFDLQLPSSLARKPSKQRYLTDENKQKIGGLYQSIMGSSDPEAHVGQCVSLHLETQDAVSKLLGCEALFTLGWIYRPNSTNLFEFDELFIAHSLQDGLFGEVNIHAWLTLPSMEIIDASLGTTLGVLWNDPKLIGGITAAHADELQGGIEYKPMLIGQDFLIRTGALYEAYVHLT